MYIASDKYGKPNLGKNVNIVGGAYFGCSFLCYGFIYSSLYLAIKIKNSI